MQPQREIFALPSMSLLHSPRRHDEILPPAEFRGGDVVGGRVGRCGGRGDNGGGGGGQVLPAQVLGHLARRELGLADVAKVSRQVDRLA